MCVGMSEHVLEGVSGVKVSEKKTTTTRHIHYFAPLNRMAVSQLLARVTV